MQDIDAGTPAKEVLKQGDVLMSVDGVSISNDGTIAFGTGERISCTWLVTQRFKGDTCKLNILRDGSEQEVDLLLRDGHDIRPRHPPTKTLEG